MPGTLLALPPFTPPTESQQIDWDHPLSDRLWGCWLMTERGSTKLRDLTGQAGPITLNASTTWTGSSALGTVPTWGTAQNASFPNGIAANAGAGAPFSIEFWLTWTNTNQGGDVTLGGILTDAADSGGIYIDTGSTPAGKVGMFNASIADSATADTISTWHHHVITSNGGSSTSFYRDGVPDGTAGSFNTVTLDHVGGNTGGADFVGGIGLLRLWKGRLLTAGEAAVLYSDPFGMLTQPLPRQLWFLGRVAAGGATDPFPAGYYEGMQQRNSPTAWRL